jgi:drug/metabolite transporter (DMT)-like permease
LATGQLAVVTVLSSVQSVVTVALAVVLHGEKPVPSQWLGLTLLLAGLLLTRLT